MSWKLGLLLACIVCLLVAFACFFNIYGGEQPHTFSPWWAMSSAASFLAALVLALIAAGRGDNTDLW